MRTLLAFFIFGWIEWLDDWASGTPLSELGWPLLFPWTVPVGWGWWS